MQEVLKLVGKGQNMVEMGRAVINSTRLKSVNWLKILGLMDAQGEKKISPEPSKHSLQLIMLLF